MTEDESLEIEAMYSDLKSEIDELVFNYTSHGENPEIGKAVREMLAERYRFE
jgi:hypothetical protein